MSNKKNNSDVTVTTTTESGGVEIQKITKPKRFLVHFRRPLGPDYDGSYGFDWLRDEYIYDLQPVLEVVKYTKEGVAIPTPTKLYNGSKIENLIKEYTRLKRSNTTDLVEIQEIKQLNQETYIPAWLAIFPISNPLNANGVDLHLQVDQESADGTEPLPLEDDGTVLTFETSTGIVVSPSKISLSKLITQKREDRELVSSVAGLSSKTVYYYKDESVKINIKATESYSEAGYIKVIATRKGKTRNVGLLMMYPNSVVPKADVQIVEFGVVPYDKSNPFTYNVELPRNYKQAIETVSFNQALIRTEVVADNIKLKFLEERAKYAKLNSLTADERVKKEAIEGLFNKYPSPEYPDKQIPSVKSLELVKDVITVFESLHPIETLESSKTELRYKGWVDSSANKRTFAIFTDYQVGKGISAIGGAADARNTSQEEKDICKINGDSCTMIWGNAVVYYRTGKNLHALVHELGHSFGLAHTFQSEADIEGYVSPAYSFYRGYTDNLMDYNDKANPSRIPQAETSNPFEENMRALFKWQWGILRSDRSVNYSDTE